MRDAWANYADNMQGLLAGDELPERMLYRGQWDKGIGRRKIHLNVPAQPFFGGEEACVFILYGNPYVTDVDYNLRNNNIYREMLNKNLREDTPFLPFDPDIQHTGLGMYWRGTLRRLALKMRDDRGCCIEQAYQELRRHLFVIEALAYPSFSTPKLDSWQNLASAQAAFEFVQGTVFDRVNAGTALALVWRQAGFWNLCPHAPNQGPNRPEMTESAYHSGCNGNLLIRKRHFRQSRWLRTEEVDWIADFLRQNER